MTAPPGGFHGIPPKKRLDQYSLVRKDLLRAEVELAGLEPSDTVLEIGAGTGILTRLIAQRAKRVIAIEKDPRFIVSLRRNCPSNVETVQGDALQVDFPPFNKVMGNVPYSISSPLLFRLLDFDFELGVLCFQREFAKRLLAKPGNPDYSRISVMVALRTRRVSLGLEIPREAFRPIPHVDSSVVLIFPDPNAPPIHETSSQIMRMIFCHKRKKLSNALRDSDHEIFKLFGVRASDIIRDVGENWDLRVSQISPQDILSFCNRVREYIDGVPLVKNPQVR